MTSGLPDRRVVLGWSLSASAALFFGAVVVVETMMETTDHIISGGAGEIFAGAVLLVAGVQAAVGLCLALEL